jgi:UvrD/REP helicase N-terminal domain
MVDEYQDLAPGLHRIVTSLSLEKGRSTLCAVGDPNQAIYAWTGTRPELLLELANPGAVHRVDLQGSNGVPSGGALSNVNVVVRSDGSHSGAGGVRGAGLPHCGIEG